MMRGPILALLCLPTAVWSGGVTIENPMVPLAPPNAMAHAAYLTLTNTGAQSRQLIGVKADGYAMAHIHQSKVENGVATMSSLDVIEIAPGQTVAFEHGGLHIMLMKPKAPVAEGDVVRLELEFANGETEAFEAPVMRQGHGSHGS